MAAPETFLLCFASVCLWMLCIVALLRGGGGRGGGEGVGGGAGGSGWGGGNNYVRGIRLQASDSLLECLPSRSTI